MVPKGAESMRSTLRAQYDQRSYCLRGIRDLAGDQRDRITGERCAQILCCPTRVLLLLLEKVLRYAVGFNKGLMTEAPERVEHRPCRGGSRQAQPAPAATLSGAIAGMRCRRSTRWGGGRFRTWSR